MSSSMTDSSPAGEEGHVTLPEQSSSVITNELVEKALRITQPGLLERQRYPSAVKEAREKMRAALEAVAGDIIEAFGRGS